MQVDSHIIIFTFNGVNHGIDHVVPHIYGVIVFKQDHSSILFIKCIQDISNGKSINRYQSGCESSYIDSLVLKTFVNISMFV